MVDGHAHVALGHAWLNTTDEAGPGPLTMAGGKLAITADCRLDNATNCWPGSASGTVRLPMRTLLMRAYLRWGEACPEHLQGDFAFAIWDSERQALFCARDHFGVKPFYYHSSDRRFVFASEIGPILDVDGVGARVSEHQISGFLAGLPDDPQSTSYTDIFRLPARHSLTVTATTGGVAPLLADRAVAKADAIGCGRGVPSSVLAIGSQPHARTPAVGAMLSGGLDSSSIACVAGLQNAAGRESQDCRPFRWFSKKDRRWTRRPFIDAVLGQQKVDGTLIAVGNYAPFAEFERILEEQEGTFLAPGLSLTRGIYRAAGAKGMKVLLDGHGGDEVVSQGHGHLHELADAGKWMELWRELRSASNTYGDGMLGLYYQFLTLYGPAWRIAKLRQARTARSTRYATAGRTARPELARSDQSGPGQADRPRRTVSPGRLHAARGQRQRGLTHRWILSNGMVPHAFEVLDKAAANFGVEPRYPFWDKPLVEFCLALPGEEKLNNGFGRHVLRRAMEGILPPAVQWRRDKIDFTSNLVNGMLGNHRDLVDKVLVSDADRIAPYVNLPEVSAAYAGSCGSRMRRPCPMSSMSGARSRCLCGYGKSNCVGATHDADRTRHSPPTPGMLGCMSKAILRERRFYKAYGLTISFGTGVARTGAGGAGRGRYRDHRRPDRLCQNPRSRPEPLSVSSRGSNIWHGRRSARS